MLLLDNAVALDDLLLALFQLFLHLLDLSLVDAVGVGQLGTLILQRGDERLTLLNELLFVLEFAL